MNETSSSEIFGKKLVINSSWCKGCGICAAFCPSKVLKIENEKVTVYHGRKILDRRN